MHNPHSLLNYHNKSDTLRTRIYYGIDFMLLSIDITTADEDSSRTDDIIEGINVALVSPDFKGVWFVFEVEADHRNVWMVQCYEKKKSCKIYI